MAGKCESNWISMTLPRTETTAPRFDGLLSFFMFAFTNLRLGFAQPLPRLTGLGMVELSDGRFGERLAERRHAVLPLRFPYPRKAFVIAEVFHVELLCPATARRLPSRGNRPYRTAGAVFRAAGQVARTRAQSAHSPLLSASRRRERREPCRRFLH